MNTIKVVVALVSITLISACSDRGKPANFDYGHVEDGQYVNSFFKVMIELPKDWVVQSQEQTESIAASGKELIAGDDEKLKATLNASDINTAYLLTAFQYEMGAAVEYNPSIMILAENIKSAPGVKTGKDYLFHARRLLEQGQLQYDRVSVEDDAKEIGGMTFYTMSTYMNYMGLEINQIYYSTVLNGFSFSVIITYGTEEQKDILLSSVQSMVFEK